MSGVDRPRGAFKGDYPELDIRPRPCLRWLRQAGALFFVFVIFVFNTSKAAVIPWPALELSAKSGAANYAYIVSIFYPTHNKEPEFLNDIATDRFGSMAYGFIALELEWNGLPRANWGLREAQISAVSFVGPLHRQPVTRFIDNRKRPGDHSVCASYVCNIELPLRNLASSEEIVPEAWMQRRRRIPHNDIADTQPWPLRGDKFFARKIDALSRQRRLLISCEPQCT